MRFRIEPRDIPAEHAARRLGKSLAEFEALLPKLLARGFPAPDPDTGNFDLDCAFRRWRPAIPTDRDHLIRLIATRATRMLAAPLDDFVMSGSCWLVKHGGGRPGSQ